MRALAILVPVCLLLPTLALAQKSERKKEIRELRKELRYLDLLAREDLRADGPAPAAGALIELEDGTVYVQEDSGLVFEKLGTVRLAKLVLRDGHRLLVNLRPPSDVRPNIGHARHEGGGRAEPPAWERMPAAGPVRGRWLVTSVDVNEYADVRAALSALVFLPGDEPTEEEIAACIARYPDHDERTSRLRCGGGS